MRFEGEYCSNCGHHLTFYDRICSKCQSKFIIHLDDLIERIMNRVKALEDFRDKYIIGKT